MHKIQTEGLEKIGYKVVTHDMKSLGLRNNPHILTFTLDEIVQAEEIVKGKSDFGGIWVARTFGNANALKKYMKNKHNEDARIFKATLSEILYINDRSIKTDRVRLYQELF
ncbi:MAG: hypothetical protein KKA65_01135 [Nanoarchaeota archaeon]|nr:hypothetical protein [Nanoarchaeota archaeon]MBU4456083.1 hypothetical protein [Nanoarchaeota archaeon]